MSVPGRTGRLTVDSLSLIDAALAADDGFGIRIPNDDLKMWSVASDTPRSQHGARSQ
jgi:acyl carrier protein